VDITYVDGDLFEGVKVAIRPLLIAHVCNDVGRWGAGFSGVLSRHFPIAEKCYCAAAKTKRLGLLGEAQVVLVAPEVYVANMVAQHGVGRNLGRAPLLYGSLLSCMQTVTRRASSIKGIHVPMFGAGLAGGSWCTIEAFIQETWCDAGIPVTVYRFKEN
jgi:O-acetyl-ADP-ribose deacetylase (regulator of RNase III)